MGYLGRRHGSLLRDLGHLVLRDLRLRHGSLRNLRRLHLVLRDLRMRHRGLGHLSLRRGLGLYGRRRQRSRIGQAQAGRGVSVRVRRGVGLRESRALRVGRRTGRRWRRARGRGTSGVGRRRVWRFGLRRGTVGADSFARRERKTRLRCSGRGRVLGRRKGAWLDLLRDLLGLLDLLDLLREVNLRRRSLRQMRLWLSHGE